MAIPTSASNTTLLASIPMFSTLTLPEIERIAVSTRRISAEKGEILFHKNDACNGFFLIISGKIKLLFNSIGGHEKVVEILLPGHTFGEAVMFMDKPYPLSAQALSDSQLLYIPKTSVSDALEASPTLAKKLISGLSMRLHHLVQNIESSNLRSGKQRVACYLLRHLPPEQSDHIEPQVQLPATKGTIASHLGMTPEHFSRVLHELIELGLIDVQGKTIKIRQLAQLEEQMNASAPAMDSPPCRN